MKTIVFSLHRNPHSPESPENATSIDPSRHAYSVFSVTLDFFSSIKISKEIFLFLLPGFCSKGQIFVHYIGNLIVRKVQIVRPKLFCPDLKSSINVSIIGCCLCFWISGLFLQTTVSVQYNGIMIVRKVENVLLFLTNFINRVLFYLYKRLLFPIKVSIKSFESIEKHSEEKSLLFRCIKDLIVQTSRQKFWIRRFISVFRHTFTQNYMLYLLSSQSRSQSIVCCIYWAPGFEDFWYCCLHQNPKSSKVEKCIFIEFSRNQN